MGRDGQSGGTITVPGEEAQRASPSLSSQVPPPPSLNKSHVSSLSESQAPNTTEWGQAPVPRQAGDVAAHRTQIINEVKSGSREAGMVAGASRGPGSRGLEAD